MNEKWKRGAVVGIASAAIVTAGGGAAMAAGSTGGSHAATRLAIAVPACAPFKPSVPGKPGTVSARPTGTVSVKAFASVTGGPVRTVPPSGITRAVPRSDVRLKGSCPALTGPLCEAALSTSDRGAVLRLRKMFRTAKPYKGAVVQVFPKGVLRTDPGGCATVTFVPCATGLKNVSVTGPTHAPRVFIMRCGPVAKARR